MGKKVYKKKSMPKTKLNLKTKAKQKKKKLIKPQTKAAAVKSKKVQPIPKGFHSVTPYLIVKGASQALDFYKKALGAKELFRMASPSGEIGHCEFKIGDSIIMMADEQIEMGAKSPESFGGSPVSLMIYVKNVDSTIEQAIAAGATLIRPVENQFYGDRSGIIKDQFGHSWNIATHIEDVSPKELSKRAAAQFGAN